MRTAANSNPRTDHWFNAAKRIMVPPAHRPVVNAASRESIEAAQAAATRAVFESDSLRVRAAEIVAITQAALIGGQAAVIAVLEYVIEFNASCVCGEDLGQELQDLMTVARGIER